MVADILEEWNPWWSTRAVPDSLKGIHRSTTDDLVPKLDLPEVIVLAGVRRSGKTTMMYQLIDHLIRHGIDSGKVLFVNLDDPSLIEISMEDIFSTYIQHCGPQEPIYLFLDEVQAKPGWERWVRKQYDLKKGIKFIVSGSSSSLLTGESSTLLTGRNLTSIIRPLSFSEYLHFRGNAVRSGPPRVRNEIDRLIHSLDAYLEDGGFPEPNLRDRFQRKELLEGYLSDILYRDVVFRHSVDPHRLTRLAVHLITNVSNPFTLRRLGRVTSMSVDTIKSYLAHLEEAFLIFTTTHFTHSSRPGVEQQRPFKVYCVDNGLRNAVGYRHSKDTGRLVENLVASELRYRHRFVFYWKGRKEVDFVVPQYPEGTTAINVCYESKLPERELDGLREISRQSGGKIDRRIILTRDYEDEIDGIEAIPLWKWLLRY